MNEIIKMNQKESVIKYIDEDNLLEQLKELETRAQQGDIESLAVRLYLKDGTYQDVVTGYKTEEERLIMLAELQRKVSTQTN